MNSRFIRRIRRRLSPTALIERLDDIGYGLERGARHFFRFLGRILFPAPVRRVLGPLLFVVDGFVRILRRGLRKVRGVGERAVTGIETTQNRMLDSAARAGKHVPEVRLPNFVYVLGDWLGWRWFATSKWFRRIRPWFSPTRIILISLTLIVLGFAGDRYVLPRYEKFKERRFVAQAERYLAEGDHRRALLNVRKALFINPANAQVCRLMARLGEINGSALTFAWYQRLAELEPSLDNRLALAMASLRYERPPHFLAEQIARDIGPAAADDSRFHVLAAQLALQQNEPSRAAAHFQQASELDPANSLHRINLSVLQLGAKDKEVAEKARLFLEERVDDPVAGLQVLRSLANVALDRNDSARALRFSGELLQRTNSVFADRLLRLAVLDTVRDTNFNNSVHEVKAVATNSVQAAQFSRWLMSRGELDQSLQWLQGLPNPMQSDQNVRLAFADCLIARRDWHALTERLESERWSLLNYLRFSLMSFAARQQGQTNESKTRWEKAVQVAGDNAEGLAVLADLAQAWQWTREREDVLFSMVTRHSAKPWTLEMLYRSYTAAGDTAALYRLYSALLEKNHGDIVVKNNFASVAMLLKKDINRACALAEEVHTKHPDNFYYTTTYAYSLHMQGRTAEAVERLQTFKPEHLEDPGIAAYYGVLLSAVGDTDKARHYLDLAGRAELLPEERALVAEARGE